MPENAAPDEGCSREFPHRLWPVLAENPECSDGGGTPHPATGPGSANWFQFGGCGSYAVFEAAPGQKVQITASGDGCGCGGCVLWHVDYEIEELEKRGFYESKQHISEPDVQCPNGKETVNVTTYQPSRGRFRLRTEGGGFYHRVCGA